MAHKISPNLICHGELPYVNEIMEVVIVEFYVFSQFELGNSSVAKKAITLVCPIQNILWRTSLEGHR
jgi:hypothetical protein